MARPKPKSLGPPKLDIKQSELESFAEMGIAIKEVAGFFMCSIDTIENRIQEMFGMTYTEFREQKESKTRRMIKRKIIEKALGGDNTMLIWCSKNMLGWSEKIDTTLKGNPDEPLIFVAKWGSTNEPTDVTAIDTDKETT